MAIGLANDKNDGDSSLTLYFEILGPIFIGLGVIGLVIIKCADTKEKRRLKKIAKEKRLRKRTTIKGHMATHTVTVETNHLEPGQDVPPIHTISGQINNNFSMEAEENINWETVPVPDLTVNAANVFPDQKVGGLNIVFHNANKKLTDETASFLNVVAPATSRVSTPLPPSDTENETQFQFTTSRC